MSEVLIFPRGQLTPSDKAKLSKAGFVAVEAGDPSLVKRIDTEPAIRLHQTLIDGDAILTSLIASLANRDPCTSGGTINSVGLACHEFVKRLSESMTAETKDDK